MQNKKIGFIGLGTMGHGMVQNLLKNNFFVNGYNRTKSKAQGIKDKNFRIFDTPSQAAEESDAIITCVSSDDALNEVLFSKSGIFDSLNSSKVLVDCSTTSVELTEKIAKECEKRNINFLDAPITGSKLGAEGGALLFMVGGDKKVLDGLMKVFDAMGKRIVYCGKNTYGQRAKIALNLTQAVVLQGYLEGLMLGINNGVPLKAMLEILENSGARTGVGSVKVPKILKRDFSPHFRLELMNKDVQFAMHETGKLGLNLPLSKELSKVFSKAMEKGLGKDDVSSLIKLIEENSKVKLEE